MLPTMNILFQNEVHRVNQDLRALADHVLDQVRCAARATVTGDKTVAAAVCRMDRDADREEVRLEEQCLRLIALHAPTAAEFRYVFGITKVIHELERIGDLAKKVARRADSMTNLSIPSTARDLTLLADLALAAASRAMDAFIAQDADKARSIWEHDPALDDIHDRLQTRLTEALGKSGAPVQSLLAARALVSSLERIGDHATRIAKVAIYTRHGQIMRHQPTPEPRPRVLFIDRKNDARSQMAEAWLKHLQGDRFAAESAGLEPAAPDPLIGEAMREVTTDIPENHTQALFDIVKNGELFAHVIIIGDDTHAEQCPIFPGVTRQEHWDLPDPVTFTGTHGERLARMRELRDAVRIHVMEWAHRIT
jgi:phosphate transport system regulatory protein PhoU